MEEGYRRSSGQKPWPPHPDRFNVFVFGGSTAFGYGVADDETIPSSLARQISERTQKDVGIYNFGRAGYRSSQERLLFESLLTDGFVPDVAIFIDGLNDFANEEPLFSRELGRLFAERNEKGMQAFRSALDRNIPKLPVVRFVDYLANLVRSESDGAGLTQGPGSDNAARNRRVIDHYFENKRLIEAAAAAYSSHAVFVWQPVPMYHYDMSNYLFADGGFSGVNRHAAAGYATMAEIVVSRDLGSDFLWCADIQQGLKESLYVDKIHYSRAMGSRVAQCISDFLERAVPM